MKHLFIKKSPINGSGLHTKLAFNTNDKIGTIHGDIEIVKKFTPTLAALSWNWIGAGRYSWINTQHSPFRYINHSCNPNTYIQGKRQVIALKKIRADEELTMDYSLTEADPDFWLPGGCSCGSKQCRGKIGPVYSLSHKDFKRLEPIITKRFKKIFLVELNKRKLA